MQDAIAFAYESSIPLRAEKHSLLLEKDLDQQVGDSDEQPSLIHGSGESSESKSSASELS